MYFSDHQPPHFHAIYGDYEAIISIYRPKVIKGHLPKRAEKMVIEWANSKEGELLNAWERVISNELPDKIKPLD